MRHRLQFRRYRLPFRAPVRTAHGVWAEREGALLQLTEGTTAGAGRVAYAEVAPLPDFGTERLEADLAALATLGEWVEPERLGEVPATLPCLRNALSAAGRELAEMEPAADAFPTLGVAALLPAGRNALAQVQVRLEAGYRVFKWKVGVGDVADELGLLDDLCAALPAGARIRLDANGAWDRRQAERWLERAVERPIEHVEQPIAPETRGARDLLLGLAADYPVPIALDESLVGDGDVEAWLGLGWRGVFVLKLALLADPEASLARLRVADATVVFSSALETAVGTRAALRHAFRWEAERLRAGGGRVVPRALGYGVSPLFADPRFDGPGRVPYLGWEDLVRINPEDLWNALS